MLDLDGVRIDERSLPGEHIDVVVVEVGRDPEPQIAHQRVRLREEIPQRRPFVQMKVDAAQLARPIARQMQRRLPQRLERDAGIRHRTSQIAAAFDQRHLLAEVGSLRGALLAGRATSNHDQIVFHRSVLPADRTHAGSGLAGWVDASSLMYGDDGVVLPFAVAVTPRRPVTVAARPNASSGRAQTAKSSLRT